MRTASRLTATCLLAAGLVCGCAVRSHAAEEPKNTEVVDALKAVALSSDAASADFLLARVDDPAIKTELWQRDFQTYFTTGAFTTALALFWESAIADAEEAEQPRIALISALCASEAVKPALPNAAALPAAYQSLATSFRWLQYVAPVLDTSARGTVYSSLAKAIGSGTLGGFASTPQQYAFYVQTSLTVCEYAVASGRTAAGRLLGLQPAQAAVWETHGILVFDNNAFSAQHYASLSSLLQAIPKRLHAIRAIIVPDSTGIPAGTGFITSGQVIYLPYIAMNVYTSPQEFLESGGRYAPQFTAVAAQEIVRAVQAVQFWKRPALAARRDIILANAQHVGARYLRHYRMVPPGTYANNPDELLPALAYIYVIDSRTVFQMAMALFQLTEEEAVDQYLLLADLLSDGGNSAPLLATSLDGAVSYATASIGRIHASWVRPPNPANGNLLYSNVAVPVDMWFCNSIAYQNTRYIFEFDDHGITTRYIR
ncbi:MAG: hypothetical protein IT366_21985 [Candidatus Hydrogenedentes bacterium]|nr:hypothetical protein [Candidatus Hydrogenedentota bacterium]